jgi:hypothetical protein
MEEAEQTKIKYTHNGDTLGNPLNIDFGINNERQECRIGTVSGRSSGREE